MVILFNFSILGHEGIIEVIDHKHPDADLNKGDRLTFHVVNCCNKCENCKDGLQQKCASLFKVLGNHIPLSLAFLNRTNFAKTLTRNLTFNKFCIIFTPQIIQKMLI